MVVSQVNEPNVVVVLDQSLLRYEEVTHGLHRDGWLVVNCKQSPEEIGVEGTFNIATVDATRVCQELGLVIAGLTVVNTAILGAFVRATNIVDMASVREAIKDSFSDDAVGINLAAITRTYEITKVKTNR